jgi:hypothetical protein
VKGVRALKEHKDGGLSYALLDLLAEEKEKKRPSALLPLLVLLVAGLTLSFFSFFFYKEENEGSLAIAKEAISELLEENGIVSVFLGLSGEGEEH